MALPHFQNINKFSSQEEIDARIKQNIKEELKAHPEWLNEILVELRKEKLEKIKNGIR